MSWTTIIPFWETKTSSQRKKIFEEVHKDETQKKIRGGQYD